MPRNLRTGGYTPDPQLQQVEQLVRERNAARKEVERLRIALRRVADLPHFNLFHAAEAASAAVSIAKEALADKPGNDATEGTL